MGTKRPLQQDVSASSPFSVNSWVCVKTSRLWKDAAVGLVTEVSSASVTVLLPSPLSLVLGWGGPRFKTVQGLPRSKVRPHHGEEIPRLKMLALLALQEGHQPTVAVQLPNASSPKLHLDAPVQEGGQPTVAMQLREASPPKSPSLDSLANMCETDLLVRLCTFLFVPVETAQSNRVPVKAEEFLGNQWSYLPEMAKDTLDFRLQQQLCGRLGFLQGQQVVKETEPECFRFLRTSKTVLTSIILGIKVSQHEACVHSCKMRLHAMMSASIRHAFKSFWVPVRRLRMLQSTDEERRENEAHMAAMFGAKRQRQKRERLEELERIAKDWMVEEHVQRYLWPVNHKGYFERQPARLRQITFLLTEVFAKKYPADPHIVALTVEEILGAQPILQDRELREALAVLHARASIFWNGDLVFLL